MPRVTREQEGAGKGAGKGEAGTLGLFLPPMSRQQAGSIWSHCEQGPVALFVPKESRSAKWHRVGQRGGVIQRSLMSHS